MAVAKPTAASGTGAPFLLAQDSKIVHIHGRDRRQLEIIHHHNRSGFADLRSAHSHLFARPQQSTLRFFHLPAKMPPVSGQHCSSMPMGGTPHSATGPDKENLYVTPLCAISLAP